MGSRWCLACLVFSLMGLLACHRQVCPSYQSLVLPFHDPDSVTQPIFTPFSLNEMPLVAPEVRKDKNHLIKSRARSRTHRDLRSLYVYRNSIIWSLFGGRYKYAPSGLRHMKPEKPQKAKPPLEAAPPQNVPLVVPAPLADEAPPTEAPQFPSFANQGEETDTYLYGYSPQDSFNVDQIYYNSLLGSFLLPPKDTLIEDTSDEEADRPTLRELFIESQENAIPPPTDAEDEWEDAPSTIEEDDWDLPPADEEDTEDDPPPEY